MGGRRRWEQHRSKTAERVMLYGVLVRRGFGGNSVLPCLDATMGTNQVHMPFDTVHASSRTSWHTPYPSV